MTADGGGFRQTALGLLLACHPLPSLAVTVFAVAWSWRIGLPADRLVVLGAAVALGQLSVGWCNDAVDASRDVAAGRPDKPVPRGLVTARTVGAAAALALVCCGVVSFLLGPLPGAVHLVAVASAWAYDLGLKATLASPLPYALSFGLLPAVATTSLAAASGTTAATAATAATVAAAAASGTAPAGWPQPGVMVEAALLGVGAHFANTLGDTAADTLTGVRGLPQVLGPARSARLTACCVVAAVLALFTAAQGRHPAAVVLLVVGGVTAAAVAVAGPRLGRRAFPVTLLAVGLVVAAFLVAGGTGGAGPTTG